MNRDELKASPARQFKPVARIELGPSSSFDLQKICVDLHTPPIQKTRALQIRCVLTSGGTSTERRDKM